jgi:hypothetical protein
VLCFCVDNIIHSIIYRLYYSNKSSLAHDDAPHSHYHNTHYRKQKRTVRCRGMHCACARVSRLHYLLAQAYIASTRSASSRLDMFASKELASISPSSISPSKGCGTRHLLCRYSFAAMTSGSSNHGKPKNKRTMYLMCFSKNGCTLGTIVLLCYRNSNILYNLTHISVTHSPQSAKRFHTGRRRSIARR